MNRKSIVAVFSVLAVSALPLFAEKITVEKFAASAVKQPDGSFAIQSGKHAFSSTIIPIKNLMGKTIVTVDLKAAPEADKATSYYVGIANFDKNGKRIYINTVNAVKGTDTLLAESCKKTDTVLKVRDGSKFPKGAFIAYNTKPDLSDLPNRTVNEKCKIVKTEKKGNIWEVTLSNKCGVDHPADTHVRAHHGGWYQYLVCGDKLESDWKSYKFQISGTQAGNPSTKWTVGTAGVLFIVFNNGKNNGKNSMFFRNLTITTADK